MEIPRGQLLRRRVLDDPGTVLANALDRELTGYARLEPQETLLLDAESIGVLVFESGVPVAAYQTGTDTGGPDAIDELATGGPYRLELYRLDDGVLNRITDSDALLVPPALPAERLAENPDLVERTRTKAPDERIVPENEAEANPVTEFLDDEQQIATIRERARDEAAARAAEWDIPVETDRADRD
jgi:hypothetical protein